MDRRGFFKLFGLGVAGIALEQAIPLGRVWSFPKEIVPLATLREMYLEPAARQLINEMDEAFAAHAHLPIGTTIRIRMPQRWYIRDADWLRRHPIIYPPDEIVTITTEADLRRFARSTS